MPVRLDKVGADVVIDASALVREADKSLLLFCGGVGCVYFRRFATTSHVREVRHAALKGSSGGYSKDEATHV